jgi:hypothetical protein
MKVYSKLKQKSIYVFVIKYLILEEQVKAQSIEIIITLCTYRMTSLLPHTVAQPTKWRLLTKNLSQLVIFVI